MDARLVVSARISRSTGVLKTRGQHREYMARYKAKRIALGLCVSCANAAPERAQCDSCLERHRLRQRASRQRADEKRKRVARESVRKGVKCGTLAKPSQCEACGSNDKLQAHHIAGYEPQDRRDVQWLCAKCHGKTHRKAA